MVARALAPKPVKTPRRVAVVGREGVADVDALGLRRGAVSPGAPPEEWLRSSVRGTRKIECFSVDEYRAAKNLAHAGDEPLARAVGKDD